MQRCHYELLNHAVRTDHVLDLSWRISTCDLYIGIVVFWSTLLFGHTLLRCRLAFLDCACIHQTDTDKKMTAITHLSSFLRMSKSLVILWDHRYLQRGWCVYELASFIALNPQGRIVILPLKMSVAKLYINLVSFLGHAISINMWHLHSSMLFSLAAVGIGTFCAGVVGIVAFEWYQREIVALQLQLDDFDFKKTQITVESDRESIVTSITEMYPNGGVT
jgi:hypothetical protein